MIKVHFTAKEYFLGSRRVYLKLKEYKNSGENQTTMNANSSQICHTWIHAWLFGRSETGIHCMIIFIIRKIQWTSESVNIGWHSNRVQGVINFYVPSNRVWSVMMTSCWGYTFSCSTWNDSPRAKPSLSGFPITQVQLAHVHAVVNYQTLSFIKRAQVWGHLIVLKRLP